MFSLRLESDDQGFTTSHVKNQGDLREIVHL